MHFKQEVLVMVQGEEVNPTIIVLVSNPRKEQRKNVVIAMKKVSAAIKKKKTLRRDASRWTIFLSIKIKKH